MSKPVILIGCFQEVIELCEKAQFEIIGIVNEEDPNNEYDYLGNDESFLRNSSKYQDVPLFLVPDSPIVRCNLYKRYKESGFNFTSIVSPDALVSKSAAIGEGCMIQGFCNVSSNVKLGVCVRVNTLSSIMHDTVVGDFTTIAPSSVILGRCKIDEKVYIGSNSTILPSLTVHQSSTIGAGAVVTKDVSEGITVVGVPARHIIDKRDS